MSSTGITVVTSPGGRGIRFPRRASVFRARGGAVVAGRVYMLAEDPDDVAEVTTENNNGDAGTLSNVVPVDAAAIDGDEIRTFVLALEAAADDAVFRGAVEAYYVDVDLTALALDSCPPLFGSATLGELTTTARAAGKNAPVLGRAIQDGASAPGLVKCHFNGTPGGFGLANAATT